MVIFQVVAFCALVGISLAQGCDQALSGSSGRFTSPNYPGNYPNYAGCVWTITADPNTQIILTFSFFELEVCPYDRVVVRDGISSTANILASVCGSSIPQPITTTGNTMYVQFTSDSSVNRRGFVATWTTQEACGQAFTGNQGSFQSPNWPSNYSNNVMCMWSITSDPNTQITLRFLSFNVTISSGCIGDSLSVYDGSSSNGVRLAKLCGSQTPGFITSSVNTMFLEFYSGSGATNSGFQVEWTTDQECGQDFTGNNGVFQSPNYPGNYPNNADCDYSITTDPGTQITLTFLDVDILVTTLCVSDFLAIYDGNDASANVIIRLCGPGALAPITTTGNQVYFQFRSNNQFSAKGFQIQWSTNPGCEQALTGTNGTIQSPNYPGYIPPNTHCVWSITVPVGSQIRVTFNTFDLQYSSDCTSDFLEIRDGNDQLGNFRDRLCGSYIPAPLLSDENELFLYLRTDSYTTGRRFQVNWSIDPGCKQNFTGNNGVFESPNYPNNYPNDADCDWLITSDPGTQITLNFLDLEIRSSSYCTSDFLAIYDGDGPSANNIARLCGTRTLAPITTTGNQVYFQFRSNSQYTDQGFKIRWSTNPGCGQALTGTNGIIQSPNYPGYVPPNTHCVWTITVPVGSQIRVTFSMFDLQYSSGCTSDFLEIRDGNDQSGTYRARRCGSSTPSYILSREHELFFYLRTSTATNERGFQASWAIEQGCGGALVGSSGYFYSPNYPGYYPNNEDCIWTITSDPGTTVTVYFNPFSLEGPSGSCPYDYVEIRDGATASSTQLAKWCGTSAPSPVTTTGNVAYVKFHTDVSVTRSGFRGLWSTSGAPSIPSSTTSPPPPSSTPAVPSCGENFINNTGFFRSPNYPNDYPNRANCTWTITSNPGTTVTLYFSSFTLEGGSTCPFDFVLIRNGIARYGPLISTKLCGTVLPGPFTATGNQVRVEFISDGSVTNPGFEVEWNTDAPLSTLAPNGTSSPGPQVSSTQAPNTTARYESCGGNFTDNEGYIESPNLPNNYPNNARCNWTVITEPGTRVRLTFTRFSLEGIGSSCPYDYVAVYDGRSSQANRLRKLCGDRRPFPITSSGNAMTVQFISDGDVNRPGFRARWMAVNATGYTDPSPTWSSSTPVWTPYPTSPPSTQRPGCGRNVTGEEGLIQSPGHPYPHHHSAYCVWNITTAPGTQILLMFSSFRLEDCYNCNCDRLIVRDGNTTSGSSNILARLCGSDTPESIRTTGNAMMIEFISDGSVAYSGFQAHWFAINSTAEWNETDYAANITSTTPSWNELNSTTPSIPTALSPECQWFITFCASQFWSSSIDASNFCSIMRQYMQCVRGGCPFVPPIPTI